MGDPERTSAVRQFLLGAGLYARGLGLIVRSPRMLALGVLPALLSGVLYTVALVTLFAYLPELTTWLAGWAGEGWRSLVRVAAGFAVVSAAALLLVLTFAAVTLLIGDPFYEKISALVEAHFGGVPDEVEVEWWRSLGRSLVDSLRLIGLSILCGIPLFLLGFIPVAGQTVVPVLGAAVGGWLLTAELTGVPFQRRGRRLTHRRAALRSNRPLSLGFGTAVFVSFLIPLAAIFLMPAAIAGATLLSRRLLGRPTSITTINTTL